MKFARLYSNLPSPEDILARAWQDIDRSIEGSTTAVVAKLVNNSLMTINVGDSGCSVFRNFEMFFRTTDGLLGWNFPQQLGMNSELDPREGIKEEFEVKPHDIIVCASDGVWDNLFPDEIAAVLEAAYGDGMLSPDLFVAAASQSLANEAVAASANMTRNTPFCEEAKRNYRVWEGGKLDDISVVVSLVQSKVTYE
jgi:protein phosphatase PTC7